MPAFAMIWVVASLGVISPALAATNPCAVLEPLWGCGQRGALNTCLATGVTYDIKILKNGISKFGVPSIDPFSVPLVTLADSGKTAVLTACKLTGGQASVISNFTSSVGSGIGYSIALPTFTLTCSYSMAAGFLGATTKNSGTAVVTMKNYRSRFQHNGSLRTQCNKVYVQWDTSTSTVLGGDEFKATFSGLGAQRINLTKLRTIALAAFQSTQSKLIGVYLQTLYSNFPPYTSWLPDTTSNRVPYCIPGKPKC